MIKIKKCKHDYKPHQFIRCEHDDYGNTIYLYELQCIKCKKKLFFQIYKSNHMLIDEGELNYDYKNLEGPL